MRTKETASDILNDLVKVNNDRVEGYQRAINESKDLDVDMKGMFEEMIKQSEQNKQELSGRIRQLGANIEQGTTSSGKIHRAWMDIKATFTGGDKKAILASCEFGEDAAQRAYEAALSPEEETDQATKDLISNQQKALKDSHDLIKKFRDAHESAS